MHHPYCTKLLDLLRHSIESLSVKFDALAQLSGKFSLSRNKRGLIDGIGDLSKWLFGTMNHADAVKIESAISQLQATQRKESLLIADTTSIVKATINNFNKSNHQLMLIDVAMQNALRRINRIIKSDQLGKALLQTKEELNLHLDALNFSCSELGLQIDEISAALLLAQQGSIHPKILAPFQLIDLLKLHPLPLTFSARYPLPLTYAYSLESMRNAQIKIIPHRNFLIAGIKIPLILPETFTLFNILPVPTSISNCMLFVKPHVPFLAISSSRSKYTPFNILPKCLTSSSGPNKFCEPENPVYNTHTRKICETEAFLFPNDPPHNMCEPIQTTFAQSVRCKNLNLFYYVTMV